MRTEIKVLHANPNSAYVNMTSLKLAEPVAQITQTPSLSTHSPAISPPLFSKHKRPPKGKSLRSRV